jgi:hypothetical protein
MFERVQQAIEFLGALPPETIVTIILSALVVAVATAGVHRRLARVTPDTYTLLASLILLTNLACILSTVGFILSKVPSFRVIETSGRPPRDRIINLYDHYAKPDAVLVQPRPRP